jgi:hypothetical protein
MREKNGKTPDKNNNKWRIFSRFCSLTDPAYVFYFLYFTGQGRYLAFLWRSDALISNHPANFHT